MGLLADLMASDRHPENDECLNCLKTLTRKQFKQGKLYCSQLCGDTAITVRYARRTIADGRYNDPLVKMAIDVRIAAILSGGYPTQERKLSPDIRAAIFARDNHLCKVCGASATEIDHIKGSSFEPSNLQAICKPCNMAKALAASKPATPEQRAIASAIWDRINAEEPTRICDDDKDWQTKWREIASARRFSAQIEAEEEGVYDPPTPWITGSPEGDEYFLLHALDRDD
jgi:hypothetical protein